jgi:hypothetical protein
VLLHQVAVAHLVLWVNGTIIVAGLELHSMNSVKLTIDEAMNTGSAAAAYELLATRIRTLTKGPEVLFAGGLTGVISVAAAIWAIRSWGAYRDAFRLSRRRSVGAFLLFVLVCGAGVMFFAWLASPVVRK